MPERCKHCKAPPAPGRKFCDKHLADARTTQARYRERLKQAKRADPERQPPPRRTKPEGICTRCSRPTVPGRRSCATHLRWDRTANRRRLEKQGRPVNPCDLCQGDHSVLDCPDYTPTEAAGPLPPALAAPLETAPLEDPSPEPEPEDEVQDVGPLPSKPLTRGDCKNGPRPCAWMTCHYHLLTLATAKTGSGPGSSTPLISTIALIRARAPSTVRSALRPLTETEADTAADEAIVHMEALGASCVLDIADQGGQTLDQVAQILGVVRERIRQIEVKGIHRLRGHGDELGEDEDPT